MTNAECRGTRRCGSRNGDEERHERFPSPRHSALLFDLDGTLIDSVELIVRSYQYTTELHLGKPLAREVIVPTIGLSLDAILEGVAPGRGALLVASYREYMHAHHDLLVRPYDGVLETLRALRERGYRLDVIG